MGPVRRDNYWRSAAPMRAVSTSAVCNSSKCTQLRPASATSRSLKALAEALEGQRKSGMKIALGAVKANIGHTLEAAGLASLVKTVLALKHQTIPKQIALRELNPGIDWNSAPFYVPSENASWQEFEDGHPRRAGVNSFGIGGLNVHVVLDEWNDVSARTVSRTSVPPAQRRRPLTSQLPSSAQVASFPECGPLRRFGT